MPRISHSAPSLLRTNASAALRRRRKPGPFFRPFLDAAPGSCQLPLDLEQSSTRPAYLLRVAGESMADAGIHDGEIVAVRKNDRASNGLVLVGKVHDDTIQPVLLAPADCVLKGAFVGVFREKRCLH